MTPDRILTAILAIELCLLGLAATWRVYGKRDLTWLDVATLLVALLVFPVEMTRVAFRRKP